MIPAALQCLTVDEVAGALRVSRSWVYAAIKTGTLPAIHVGRSLRVRREVLAAYLDANAHEPATRDAGWIDVDEIIRRTRRQVG